ncbi:MAG: heavy metal-binding domain-containing protein [Candidatus Bathyarchaeia archaeon]|nr:heavy metal-binding domain-containing protein [Candidatus Bathyarchaeota archaeon]
MKCPVCDTEVDEGARFCPRCGASLEDVKNIMVSTTPTIPGYRIKKVIGIVTGLSPRTRGMLGRFIAGIETIFGGEIRAFTTEIEKARMEALERMKAKAAALGANAVVGVDLETSDLGLGAGIIVITATGTAVMVEPET